MSMYLNVDICHYFLWQADNIETVEALKENWEKMEERILWT